MAIAVTALKEQIEKAKESLKSVDDNIKKMTGRDPNELSRFDRGRVNRGREVTRLGRRMLIDSSDPRNEPPAKRTGGIFRRVGSMEQRRKSSVSGKPAQQSDEEDEDDSVKPVVQSSVVSTAKNLSKTDVISAQNVDEKGRARNRRMFGVLMGTLARFQNDESKADLALKQEQRRSEIERKLEAEQATDRRRAAAERRELFSERRSKQLKINLLEEKIELAAQFEEWEAEWKKKSSFLITKTCPPVFFLPKDSTARTTRALSDTQQFIKGKIDEARTSLEATLRDIDGEIRTLDAVKDKEGASQKGAKDITDGGRKAEGEDIDDLDEEPAVDINVDVDDGKGKTEEGMGVEVGSDPEAMDQENGKIDSVEAPPKGEEKIETDLVNGDKNGAKTGQDGVKVGQDVDGKCPGDGDAVTADESMISSDVNQDPLNQGFRTTEDDAQDPPTFQKTISGDDEAPDASVADDKEAEDDKDTSEDAADEEEASDQSDVDKTTVHITQVDDDAKKNQSEDSGPKDAEQKLSHATDEEASNTDSSDDEVEIIETSNKTNVMEVVEITSSPTPPSENKIRGSSKKISDTKSSDSRSNRRRRDSSTKRARPRKSRSRSRSKRNLHRQRSRRSRSPRKSRKSPLYSRSEAARRRRNRSTSSSSSSSSSDDDKQRSGKVRPRKRVPSRSSTKHRRRRSSSITDSSSSSNSSSSSSSQSPPRRRRKSADRRRRSSSRSRRSRSTGGRRR